MTLSEAKDLADKLRNGRCYTLAEMHEARQRLDASRRGHRSEKSDERRDRRLAALTAAIDGWRVA